MASTNLFLVVCGVIALASLPLALGLVPRNSAYGMRTPRTLASDAIWFPANRFAGCALLAASCAAAALLLFVPEHMRPSRAYDAALLAVPILLAVAASFWYLNRLPKHPGQ